MVPPIRYVCGADSDEMAYQEKLRGDGRIMVVCHVNAHCVYVPYIRYK